MAEEDLKGFTRVTEILWPFSEIKHVDPQVLAKAADRGTRVHNCCEAVIEGLGEFVDEDIVGYMESFHHWWPVSQYKLIEMERRFFCHRLYITGKVDLILQEPNGKNTLVDLKTSARPSKTWLLQGSAYAYLAGKEGLDIDSMVFVRLKKDGKKPCLYSYTPDIPLFLKVYEVYKYFYEKS